MENYELNNIASAPMIVYKTIKTTAETQHEHVKRKVKFKDLERKATLLYHRYNFCSAPPQRLRIIVKRVIV